MNRRFFFLFLDSLIAQPMLSLEERRKRGFICLFLLLITPTMIFLAVTNWRTNGLTTDVLLGITGIAAALASLVALRYLSNVQLPTRLGIAYTLFMICYLLVIGGAGGLAYLWFYFFPLIAYFVFGTHEGLLWVATSWFVIVCVIFFNLGTYIYPLALGARMLISYSIVCILAHGMEWSRSYFYHQLLLEKQALEEAMHQVKTLQTLLPICASCKKIRDDSGYWHQVESYIHDHVGVEFSHSICPECRVRLYPKIAPHSTEVN